MILLKKKIIIFVRDNFFSFLLRGVQTVGIVKLTGAVITGHDKGVPVFLERLYHGKSDC